MKVGEFIQNKRRDLKLSQRDLAIKCNLSNAEISRIESGLRKQPSPETLKAIAAVLNVNVNDLYEAFAKLQEIQVSHENLIALFENDLPDSYIK